MEKVEALKKSDIIEILQKRINTAWSGHGYFAVWLVEYLQPEVTVDLGVDYGYSTLCFLLGSTSGDVYGLDSFEGDIHAGIRDTLKEVLNNYLFLKSFYKELNPRLNIVKGYFHDLSLKWCKDVNRPIDILHIDGLHDYESVKMDFTDLVPFTNYNAVILMHDTLFFPETVGKFFHEIPYPKFNFLHTHGLGVVCKNKVLLQTIHILMSDKSFGEISDIMNV